MPGTEPIAPSPPAADWASPAAARSWRLSPISSRRFRSARRLQAHRPSPRLQRRPARFRIRTAPAAAQGSDPPPLTNEQLDQLVAPIALYPDSLLAQILMASTYPLEVVEAARWAGSHPGLEGEKLENALQDQTWDASVKSLVAFPQVLTMMNDQLDWTQKLGDAFLAQQKDVMAAVQRRGIMTVMPILAVAALVSGLWLYLRAAGGQHAEFARSGPGMAFGLGGLAAIEAGHLSAGQTRRLSLARLLVSRRPVWLLDEPTSSLDTSGHELVGQLMREHAASGGTVMVATRDASSTSSVT